MIDEQKLTEGLNKLTGNDLIAVEREERAVGNTFPTLNFTTSYQARLAARALGMNVYDITALPAREFNRVILIVVGFLFNSDASTSADK